MDQRTDGLTDGQTLILKCKYASKNAKEEKTHTLQFAFPYSVDEKSKIVLLPFVKGLP